MITLSNQKYTHTDTNPTYNYIGLLQKVIHLIKSTVQLTKCFPISCFSNESRFITKSNITIETITLFIRYLKKLQVHQNSPVIILIPAVNNNCTNTKAKATLKMRYYTICTHSKNLSTSSKCANDLHHILIIGDMAKVVIQKMFVFSRFLNFMIRATQVCI